MTCTYGSNNVSTKHPISVLICQDLHKSVSVIVRFRSAISSEWEFSYAVFDALKYLRLAL